jgi:hypothetical protein
MEKERAPGSMWAEMTDRYGRGYMELLVETLPDTQAIDLIEIIEHP